MKNLNIATNSFLKPRALCIWAFSLQLGMVQQAFAQTDTIKKLKEVNVKVASIAKQQNTVPSQHLSVSDFSRYGALNVADVVTSFAGVNLRDYGGIGGLKTISVRSLGANHTGVLYDGIQLNDAQSGQIDLGKFNLYNIQDITLYNGQSPRIVQPARSFASASVLDIATVRPHLTINKPYQIRAGVNAGSFGLINPFFQWQQRISNRWSLILNGTYTGANGRYKYKNETDGSDTLAIRTNSDVKAFQTDGALYWAKSDSNKFKLQFNYYNSNRGLPGPVANYQANSIQRLQNRDLIVQSTYDYTASSGVHLLLNSKYGQSYLHYTYPNYFNNTGGIDEHYNQHEFYQSASVGYHILPVWEIAYAADVSVMNLQADVYQYTFKYALPTRLTLLNTLATNIDLGKWHIQGNLLHTYITETVKNGPAAVNRSVFSPTVMISLKPFEQIGFLLRAFYKDIYRAPTFAEQYYYAVAPRSIRPEHGRQYNLGATYSKSFDGILSDIALTADAYFNHIKDKIIYIPVRSPDVPSVTNLGEVDIKGLDVTLKTAFIPAHEWQGLLSASYTYQLAQDVTDSTDTYYLDQIPYTPKHLLNLNAGFTHRQFGAYYTYTWSSLRYYISNNQPEYAMPAYHTSNVSFIYHFLTQKTPVTASFEVNNLGNLNYSVINSYPMPGRSYRLSLQITI